LYPAAFAGKTIKAYAVALENTIKGRQVLNSVTIPDGFTPQTKLVNGTQNTSTLLEDATMKESGMVIKFNEFVASHTLTAAGTTTTEWYIPAQVQFQEWSTMIAATTLFPANNDTPVVGPTGTEAFKALFPKTNLFDRDNLQNCMYVTCSVNDGGNVMGGQFANNADLDYANVTFNQIDIKTKTQSVLCRPMFTIFE
ncbi:MAG: hypothetical protein K2F91_06500, partial [Muribaculaceae bacterium]|nr:hypothetical protein [Muribaculaceae bacterium]